VANEATREAAGTTEPVRILIVDDDRAMRDYIAQAAEESGYQAVKAENWSEAVQRFRESRPDLVLLDVMMPGIDGYKMARMLKTEARERFVPIILLTALEDVESKRRGMAAGADDFLTKPVSPVELQIRLSSMLRIKALADALGQANARLAELAVTDPLTGLANRRALNEQIEREWSRARRYERPLGFLILDIDHFKVVNDSFGHAVGDQVLQRVSQVVRQTVRTTDMAARFGGEELVVLAPETGTEACRLMGERVREAVAASDNPGTPRVTVSIGVSSTEIEGLTRAAELVESGDQALYRAKHAGRNRVEVGRKPGS
jgi:diguanylate cyclase (GGDEF)-like protein